MEAKNRNRQFNLRMTDDELSLVKALSRYFGIPDSDAVRLCIDKTIAKLEEIDPNWNKKVRSAETIFDKRKDAL